MIAPEETQAPAPVPVPALAWAHQGRPYPGQSRSGDQHVVARRARGVVLGVVDGLGHGEDAAVAARLAVQAVESSADDDPARLLALCHEALRGSRGAAMSLVSVQPERDAFTWAGVGNVEAWRLRPSDGAGGSREALIAAPGVVGYQMPALRLRGADLRTGDLLVLFSDGVRPDFAGQIGLARQPAEVAGAIMAGYARANDDALVLVARYGGGGS